MAEQKHDLIVIGAGPAGLAASIAAESERVDTVVLDAKPKLGGQAVTSSFIENYAGFPGGISGRDLMGNFINQALRFDTEFQGPIRATSIDRVGEDLFEVETDENVSFFGRSVLIACGVEYRLLRARNLAAYLGRGAEYGSPNLDVDYSNKRIIIVGGANSAGQAAAHLSDFDGSEVTLFIRGDSIEKGMSGYLIDKLESKSNVNVMTNINLTGLDGNEYVESATYSMADSEDEHSMPIDNVFVMIGSEPKTLWLPDEKFEKDNAGFVVAGSDMSNDARNRFIDNTKGRAPLGHETTTPGVFVAGDIRCGTDKRVALAAGDGAGVVPDIHRYRASRSRSRTL